jgi:glycyl-tRNA synthetase
MMFKTNVGANSDAASVSYLRPETAGGIFVNFKNVVDSLHPKLPFGIGQIGKAFRNEIAPRDFIFRSREFEQMEIEYFVKPDGWQDAFEKWRVAMLEWCTDIGLPAENVYEKEIADEDRAHYSKRTIDIEFDYPFGRKELYGLAYRTNYDLSKHQEYSKQSLEYFDEETGQKFVPHVVEPSLGVDRSVLAVLTSAYCEDEVGGETRVFLKFVPKLAPIKMAVFPLLKNRPEIIEKAKAVYVDLKKTFGNVAFDESGNIGKRYRRQDEVGTPFCITIDFDTIGAGEDVALKDTVTVRERDSGIQTRIALVDLKNYLQEKLA